MSSPNENESVSHLAAVPDPQEGEGSVSTDEGMSPEESEVAPVEEPAARFEPAKPEDDRVARPLFLLVLLGFLICAIGFGVQSQRVGEFQTQVSGLEGEVSALTSDLAAANDRVQGFEVQRRQVQQSVQEVLQDVLALEALVA